MSWIQRLNNFFIGLLVGIVFPGIIFILYWLFFHHQISFPMRFIRYLVNGYLLSNVIKICGLANILLFYFGLTNKIDSFSKGIICSIFLYVGLIAYVTYYLEPEYI
jgi:hypothetical protein